MSAGAAPNGLQALVNIFSISITISYNIDVHRKRKQQKEKFLDIKKNRFDGSLGRVNLFFDQESNMYKDDDTILDSKTNSQKPSFTDNVGADIANNVEEVVVVVDEDDKDEFEEIIMD